MNFTENASQKWLKQNSQTLFVIEFLFERQCHRYQRGPRIVVRHISTMLTRRYGLFWDWPTRWSFFPTRNGFLESSRKSIKADLFDSEVIQMDPKPH